MDTWVFDHFKNLFEKSKTNSTLNNLLHQDKIVFFLHLLGLDTNGHAHRPYSEQYLSNIGVVDAGLKKVESLIKEYYQDDKKTAFVLASDHGMSNRGSHGDGDPQNTETPIVVWGAGINRPDKQNPTGHDAQSKSWKLDKVQRNDINQADVAPLMASLIGVPFPMNSVGTLPLAFLSNTEEYKAKAIYQNALGILAQYLKKSTIKGETELLFQPFQPLLNYSAQTGEIEQDIKSRRFDVAVDKTKKFMGLLIEGLRYYQTYDWLLLRSIVSLGYLGWITYSTIFIIKTYSRSTDLTAKKHSFLFNVISFLLFSGICILLHFKDSPVSYYFYAAFPVWFWTRSLGEFEVIYSLFESFNLKKNGSTIVHVFFYLASLEVLVLSYFYREILTVCLLVMGFVWPFFMPAGFRERHYFILRAWRTLCFITSIFTLLPVELEEDVFSM